MRLRGQTPLRHAIAAMMWTGVGRTDLGPKDGQAIIVPTDGRGRVGGWTDEWDEWEEWDRMKMRTPVTFQRKEEKRGEKGRNNRALRSTHSKYQRTWFFTSIGTLRSCGSQKGQHPPLVCACLRARRSWPRIIRRFQYTGCCCHQTKRCANFCLPEEELHYYDLRTTAIIVLS